MCTKLSVSTFIIRGSKKAFLNVWKVTLPVWFFKTHVWPLESLETSECNICKTVCLLVKLQQQQTCIEKVIPTSCSQCAEMKEPHDGAITQAEMLLYPKSGSFCFLWQICGNRTRERESQLTDLASKGIFRWSDSLLGLLNSAVVSFHKGKT